MRSARRIASPTSWVTSTVVTARSATRAASSRCKRQRQRPVERNERLVEQQERRADGEGARQRDAPRKAERQFAGKMRAMVAESEQLQERLEIAPRRSLARRGGCCPRRCATARAAAPGRQMRAGPAGRLTPPSNAKVEAGDDPQRCRLAAAGRPDQRADLAGVEPEGEIRKDLDLLPGGVREALSRDANLKRTGAASGRHGVQRAEPRRLRRSASPR